MIGIYKIINTINNKIYIGQSVNIQERISEHKTTYIVEQIETKDVSKYKYKIILYPENIVYGWFDYKLSD